MEGAWSFDHPTFFFEVGSSKRSLSLGVLSLLEGSCVCVTARCPVVEGFGRVCVRVWPRREG
jgi:hypothetical protein